MQLCTLDSRTTTSVLPSATIVTTVDGLSGSARCRGPLIHCCRAPSSVDYRTRSRRCHSEACGNSGSLCCGSQLASPRMWAGTSPPTRTRYLPCTGAFSAFGFRYHSGHNIQFAHLLQHISTVCGIAVLAIWFAGWYRRTLPVAAVEEEFTALEDYPGGDYGGGCWASGLSHRRSATGGSRASHQADLFRGDGVCGDDDGGVPRTVDLCPGAHREQPNTATRVDHDDHVFQARRIAIDDLALHLPTITVSEWRKPPHPGS